MRYRFALTLPVAVEECPESSPASSEKSSCPVCASPPHSASSSLSSILKELHGHRQFCSRLRAFTSQPGHTALPARVHAAHIRLFSLCRYSVLTFRFKSYRAFSASQLVLCRCSPPMLIMGRHGVQFSFAHSSSSPIKVERKDFRKSPNDC